MIGQHRGGSRASFTVRKISYGVGVERIFPLHTSRIEKIEVVTRGHVRRARLNYLRELQGKAARIKGEKGRSDDAAATGRRLPRRCPAAAVPPPRRRDRRRAVSPRPTTSACLGSPGRAPPGTGRRAEDLAAAHLEPLGLRIVARNWRRGPKGELDIVADDDGTCVFVEVRSRTGEDAGPPPRVHHAAQAGPRHPRRAPLPRGGDARRPTAIASTSSP